MSDQFLYSLQECTQITATWVLYATNDLHVADPEQICIEFPSPDVPAVVLLEYEQQTNEHSFAKTPES